MENLNNFLGGLIGAITGMCGYYLLNSEVMFWGFGYFIACAINEFR